MLPDVCFPAYRWQITSASFPTFYVRLNHLIVVACILLALTAIVLVKWVHAGEVDGEGLEGRRQADAALRSLHVEARRRARVGRLGQARLGIFHAEYCSRRLGWLSAAPHGSSNSTRKEESSGRCSHRLKPVQSTQLLQPAPASCCREKISMLLSFLCQTKWEIQHRSGEVRLLIKLWQCVEDVSSRWCFSFWILDTPALSGSSCWTSLSSFLFVLRSPGDSNFFWSLSCF